MDNSDSVSLMASESESCHNPDDEKFSDSEMGLNVSIETVEEGTDPEPTPAGSSPKRTVQRLYFPEINFITYQGSKQLKALLMDITKAGNYMSVFSKPSRYNPKFCTKRTSGVKTQVYEASG